MEKIKQQEGLFKTFLVLSENSLTTIRYLPKQNKSAPYKKCEIFGTSVHGLGFYTIKTFSRRDNNHEKNTNNLKMSSSCQAVLKLSRCQAVKPTFVILCPVSPDGSFTQSPVCAGDTQGLRASP
jgi:hypothetical protein